MKPCTPGDVDIVLKEYDVAEMLAVFKALVGDMKTYQVT